MIKFGLGVAAGILLCIIIYVIVNDVISKKDYHADLNVNDTIKCHDEDELMMVKKDLQTEGYLTEIIYEVNNEYGLYLLITGKGKG